MRIVDHRQARSDNESRTHCAYLRETVGVALKAFAATANEKGLALTCRVSPQVLDLFIGDDGRLSQILLNLVGNALKFTRAGEVVVTIELDTLDELTAMLTFSVRDTGIGITQDQQAHIFNAFAQADASTTRKYGGTGLGLAIVSQLVALMHGRVWVESAEGSGTTFYFTAQLEVVAMRREVMPRASIDLNRQRVLVVDDNRTNLLILEEIFTNWKMRPTLVENGSRAMEELWKANAERALFPLVVLDARMPGQDGFELAHAIKSTPTLHPATVMLLSSSDLAGEAARCRTLGVAQFLRKPVKQSELYDAILSALNGAPTARPAASRSGAPLAKLDRSLKVLVAEDHPINQRLAIEILRERGHTAVIACNGIEALNEWERQPFDVILMDGHMPEMDGYQASMEIRRRETGTGQHIRIIAVTAHAMNQARETCLAAGMGDYLSKPINGRQLLALLEEHTHGATEVQDAIAPASAAQSELAFDAVAALARARDKPALLQQLVGMFQTEAPAALAQLQAAIAARNAEQLSHAAHRLKGAAVNLSANAVAEAAGHLEDAAEDADWHRIDSTMQTLTAALSEVNHTFKAWLLAGTSVRT